MLQYPAVISPSYPFHLLSLTVLTPCWCADIIVVSGGTVAIYATHLARQKLSFWHVTCWSCCLRDPLRAISAQFCLWIPVTGPSHLFHSGHHIRWFAADAETGLGFRIFPFLSRSLPDCNDGLAVNNIEECIPYILSFVWVMQSWKGNKLPIFNLAAWSYQEIPQIQASALEEAATKYSFSITLDMQPYFLIISLCLS